MLKTFKHIITGNLETKAYGCNQDKLKIYTREYREKIPVSTAQGISKDWCLHEALIVFLSQDGVVRQAEGCQSTSVNSIANNYR